jgi:hypothetical protein
MDYGISERRAKWMPLVARRIKPQIKLPDPPTISFAEMHSISAGVIFQTVRDTPRKSL